MGGPTLEIGITPWQSTAQGTAEVLCEQAERAERLGFHSLWLPEGHFSGAAAIPQPLLWHAAIAARTTRLRLGTTSYLLPIRHPLQVAEEVAVLDRLSGGRVILGVGRGFRQALFSAFDVDRGTKRDRFEAALTVMRDAWAGRPVAAEGDAPGAPAAARAAAGPAAASADLGGGVRAQGARAGRPARPALPRFADRDRGRDHGELRRAPRDARAARPRRRVARGADHAHRVRAPRTPRW